MSKHRARKRFGQHFLADPGVIQAIVNAIGPQPDDIVVEIGPGQGAITTPLLAACSHLHVIELDRNLAATLRTRYAANEKITVHEGDALEFDFSSLGGPLRVVGNLPYNISTPLLFRLLAFRKNISDMHFMLQKEVVDRMAASPGNKAYGRLGIMLGLSMSIESLFDVDRSCFEPPPEVTSAVVRLTPLPANTFEVADEVALARLVATAFSQRRKTVRNALKSVATEDLLEAAGIDPGQRPETVGIPEWVALANLLSGADDSNRRDIQ